MKEENKFAIKACEYKFKAILFTMLGNKDYKQMRVNYPYLNPSLGFENGASCECIPEIGKPVCRRLPAKC